MKTLVLIVLFSFSVLGSCAREETSQEKCGGLTQLTEPKNALSEELMVALGLAKNFHYKADILVNSGEIEDAAKAVAMILDVRFPEGSPEAEDVLLDARARLATLRIQQGQLDEAMSLVDDGIAMSSRNSFFLANLHTVRGEVFEARAALAETGSEEARAATIEAIKSLDASIKINESLLDSLGSGEKQ